MWAVHTALAGMDAVWCALPPGPATRRSNSGN